MVKLSGDSEAGVVISHFPGEDRRGVRIAEPEMSRDVAEVSHVKGKTQARVKVAQEGGSGSDVVCK